MKEPSVLDYVKSKITFWKPSSVVIPSPEPVPQIPPAEQPAPVWQAPPDLQAAPDLQVTGAETPGPVLLAGGGGPEALPAAASTPVAVAAVPAVPQPQAKVSSTGAFLALSALLVALIAQALLEPPNRAWPMAMAFYAGSAVLIGIAYFRSFIAPAAVPEKAVSEEIAPETAEIPAGSSSSTADFVVNTFSLVAGLILMAAAFFAFYTLPDQEVPLFDFLNTTLWLLSIGYLVLAFYLPGKQLDLAAFRDRVIGWVKAPRWNPTITRWTILLLLVTGMVLFFRFYHLNSLPADAVSDQAEKLLDVNDVLNSQLRIFFPRNTGREMFQFYWTALIIKLFNTGVTFLSLKIGTTLIGLLAVYYIYRIGREIGNRWVALLAVIFCGFSYWAQTQARIGLRFTLYPGFYAPMLFYLIRGLRSTRRNDFIWAGLWLGIGLQGYTSYRIVPFVVVAAFVIYYFHQRTPEMRRFAWQGLVIVAVVSLAVFLPLFRLALENPDLVAFRSLTRIGSLERPLPGSPVMIFLQNTWNALVMFFWDDGDVWVHSIPHRPALDVISAALFFLGLVLVFLRYLRKRTWLDLFMLVSIPLLLLPSIFSLAFPNENPNLNRTAAAYIPAFLILAIGLEALLSALKRSLAGRWSTAAPALVGLALVLFSARANYDLLFNQYDQVFRSGAWNSSEMGAVVRQFDQYFGQNQDAWVVAFPYWVDTRLVGIEAGYPTRDMSINVEGLAATVDDPRNKLFILNPADTEGLSQLTNLYPDGRYWEYKSRTAGKDFMIFFVLSKTEMPQEGAGFAAPAGELAPTAAP